jgi:cytosine/adenosine deaminase-related metal-dependent hydrolase
LITAIRGSYVVGFDPHKDVHVLYRNGEVAFEGDRIVYAGPRYPGEAQQRIEADGCLVAPGLINMHALMDVGIHQFLLDRRREPGMVRPRSWVVDPEQRPVFSADEIRAGAEHTFTTMARSGVTTFCGITAMVFKRWHDPDWEPEMYAEAAGRVGLRAYLSHHYRAGAQYVEPDGAIGWEWDEAKGFEGLERNIAFKEAWHGAYDDRIRVLLFPYTCDQVTKPLLLATRDAAERHGIGIRMHFAQSNTEMEEIARRYGGMTPVEYLDSIDFLGPHVMLTHGIYGRGHDGGPWMCHAELETLARRGVTVINCPWIYSMRGSYLRSFSRYLAAGVNVCIGTDTQPNDILRELRFAAIMGKVADGSPESATARDVFNAVTVNAARYLGRDDLGRLTPGAKADIVVIDLRRTAIGPHDDPIRSLVYYASLADVRDVWVDGRAIVQGHACVGFAEADVVSRAQPVADKVKRTLVAWDRLGRSEHELYPPAFEIR